MKRILINATHNEETRVALCKGSHLYDFDLENRTREQKKSNIYKGKVTRIEPSLEAAFVEYGSAKQGFLSLRNVAPEYLKSPDGDPNNKSLQEGQEIIIQIAKEERGKKGAAVSTFISLAGRYLVLMPNNTRGGGISRQISGKVRDEMRQIMDKLVVPAGMSVILRTAGFGRSQEELAQDLTQLQERWAAIVSCYNSQPAPVLLHQEAGVVTRAMRDYLRDDIDEIWIDSQDAYNEAANFIAQVMPSQMEKLRKYTNYEPLFVHFGIEKQIETAYQREVRLPSGGSIVIDQTEALVSIDINSAKSTKGADVAQTAYHTNLEAADEIARQLRLRDMGGLIVIDFIDMVENAHQKTVEKRLIDATRHDRAKVQFAEISRFGLLEMSRQRLRPSLEESTGGICPRCHGNGMIRDLRSLSLSIMREIEQMALAHRGGEVQAEVPTEIAAFLLNEKRESLVYLEQDSETRITILPHAHLESPNFSLKFNPDGFAPASYERISDVEGAQEEGRGYEINWQTPPTDRQGGNHQGGGRWENSDVQQKPALCQPDIPKQNAASLPTQSSAKPAAVAWLTNLFAPKVQATPVHSLPSGEAAAAIESLVNSGASSLGALGVIAMPATPKSAAKAPAQDKTPAKNDKVGDKKPARQSSAKPATASKAPPTKPTVQEKKPANQSSAKPASKAADKQDKTPAKSASAAASIANHNPPNKKDFSLRIERQPQNTPAAKTIHLSLDVVPESEASLASTQVAPLSADLAPEVQTTQIASTAAVQQGNPAPSLQAASIAESIASNQPPVSAIALTPEAVIKARLSALATELNLVKNDPRVVAQVLNRPVLSNTPAKTAITGTAGAFIANVLQDSAADLHAYGFVATFIKALDQLAATNLAADKLASDKAAMQHDLHCANSDLSHFDFANYGYAPLAQAYLEKFHHDIASKGAFAAMSGKTDIALPAPTTRAKNDPRGQYKAPSAAENRHQNVAGELDALNAAGKTSPTAYKNMIENIAEQLLPPSAGMKLALPKEKKVVEKKGTKVAIKLSKNDSKPKTEIRKRKTNSSDSDSTKLSHAVGNDSTASNASEFTSPKPRR